jgi:hypothetical protein
MACILYYSNHCEPSQKILQIISRTKLTETIHFICIDNRYKDNKGQIIIQLEKNQKVLLPPTVNKVPALLLLNQGNQVLFENQIYQYLKPQHEIINHQATNFNDEPECFSLSQLSCRSDAYSFLNDDDFSVKGNAGLRQMHNYSMFDDNTRIITPPEDYKSEKMNNENTAQSLDRIKAERMMMIPEPQKRM